MSEVPKNSGVDLALAAIPSGCSILTCTVGKVSTGMLASWVQQAAFEPPMVSVAVKSSRYVRELIEQSGGFTLNLLGVEPWDLFKHFGAGFGPEDDAFKGLTIEPGAYGPRLARAIAYLDCKLAGSQPAGDHVLYVGAIEDGVRRGEDAPYVHMRKSGFSY